MTRAAPASNPITSVSVRLNAANASGFQNFQESCGSGESAAKANRDKAAETRINRMCDEAVALIKLHLGEEKVRLLSEEMEALQSADVEPKQ
jgi:hypothetical protein